jgi:hypothetical protein
MTRVRCPAVARHFSQLHSIQTGSGASHPVIQCIPENPLGIKEPGGHEADHSPSFIVEVKNCGAISPLLNTTSFIYLYIPLIHTRLKTLGYRNCHINIIH